MRLFFNNLIDASAVAISATSEVSTLPAENVAHEFRAVPWRTGTSVALEAVVFDLGSAQAVTAVILLDHTLTAGDTLIKLQGHTSDSWGAPAFEQSLTYAADVISATFASQSYRYWRVTFTKSAAGQSRDIGRIFIGTYYETEDEPDYDGFGKEFLDLSRKQKSLGGQTYTELLPQYQKGRCDFSRISDTMMTALLAYVAAVGQSVSHFIQVATSSPFNPILYVKLSRAVKADVTAMESTPVWDTSLEYEEQL